jgi:hypothetical protein
VVTAARGSDHVVVQRSVHFAQEGGQATPMAQQIGDRLAQAGVRFRFLLRHLCFQPAMQFRHHRSAVLLMKLEPLGRRQAAFPGFGFDAVHSCQHLENVTAFSRKALHDVNKLPSSVRETVRA